MKNLLKLLLIFIVFTTQSCDKDCDGYACMTPPNYFVFEIVDKTTGENLFSNGTYKQEDIEVVNMADNSDLEYSFISEDNANLIIINSIGWKTEKITVLVKISDEEIFSLYVDAERVSEDCCSFTRYNKIEIGISPWEKVESDLYKIFIE